jgi:hypothetical protein
MKTHYNLERSAQIFYDRHLRLWTLIRLDAEGNQVGAADYTTCSIRAKMWLNYEAHLAA